MENIHSSEIWAKSRCLEHEDLANQQIFDCLARLGYLSTDHFRIWKKENKTVIVSLVDDVRSCSNDYHVDLPYLFDCNTTVITDNHLTCPSVFGLIKIPVSFFGIYNYTPDHQNWEPDRDFALQVNRIDAKRFKILIDLAWRSSLDLGYVNFNCEYRVNPSLTPQQAFELFCSDLGPDEQKYISTYKNIWSTVPVKNYNIDFETVPYRAWINIIIETYSSDNVISLSEKIFRALITPAPWTVCSGRYTVAYLESLGFDCMSDIIDHKHYDRLKEVEDKMSSSNWKSLEIVKTLKQLGHSTVQDRCIQASIHNQQLLTEMNQRWTTDFSSWLETLPSQLSR